MLQMVKCMMPTVTIKGGYSLGTMTEDRMELYTGGAATSLAKGNTILALQEVERKCGTINYSIWKLCEVGVACRNKKSRGS